MFSLLECSIKDIKLALYSNELSSKELILLYLRRISEIDQGPIKYNSVLEINPDALFEAELKDHERSLGKDKGILHGIPILLKDNINTLGKMHTTAGTKAFENNYAPYDAFIVKRLKEEGAIILGKTNLTELANFMTQNMVNGYSSLGGKVLCPYNIDKDPSGSSSGSAVSVSLNLTPISIGTETGGSIISPSMQNGVVGIKPTMGLCSRTGIVPISSTLDIPGPIAKNVYDAALLLSAMRGNDVLDPITNIKENIFVDYTKCLNNINPKSLRVGIDKSNFDILSSKRKDAFKHMLELLLNQKVTLIEALDLKPSTKIYHVMLHEFKQVFNNYLASLKTASRIKTLHELILYNRTHEKECLKYGQVVIEEAQYKTSGHCNEIEYIESLEERDVLRSMLHKTFKDNNLDAIYFANYTSLGPHCGYPAMTVPIGIAEDNIPVGSYLLGSEFGEERLLKVAQVFENVIKGRVNPIQKKEE